MFKTLTLILLNICRMKKFQVEIIKDQVKMIKPLTYF